MSTNAISSTKFPIGYGAMGLSEFYGSSTEDSNKKTLQAVLDNECYFIDTADMYGSGHNEELLGPFVQKNREKVFICTKFALLRGPGGTFEGIRGDAAYVKEACDASLKRLGIDQIDLYYQHRVDPKTPIEETMGALKDLQEAGKIKYIGLSECSAETLRRASKIAHVDAVQWEYSVFTTDVETNGVLDACKELGTTLVAYSPLGRGLISVDWETTDDIPADDFRKYLPRFQGESLKANMKLVHRLREIAAKKGVTANQLALAWVMSQGAIPIPGTKTIERLEENLGAKEVKITEEEHQEIRQMLEEIKVEGDRYADMSGVNA